MAFKNNSRSSARSPKGGKSTGSRKFSNDRFIMMQVGKQFLDEGDYGWKTRILFSNEESEYSWCVRDKNGVSYWFGRKLGLQLLFRAIEAGQALGTSSFFERDGEYSGNPRINIKGVATEKELALGKRNAEQEAWLDAADDEEEDERPARKSSSKSKSKRTYPELEEDLEPDVEETEEEDTDEDDDYDS